MNAKLLKQLWRDYSRLIGDYVCNVIPADDEIKTKEILEKMDDIASQIDEIIFDDRFQKDLHDANK